MVRIVRLPSAQAQRPASSRTSLVLDRRSGRQIFEPHTVTAPQTVARLGYAPQELRMVLQSVVEPVVFAFTTPNAAYQPRRALRAVGCMRLFGDR